MAEVEKFRKEAYDCENVKHEEMLMKVQTQIIGFKYGITANISDADWLVALFLL